MNKQDARTAPKTPGATSRPNGRSNPSLGRTRDPVGLPDPIPGGDIERFAAMGRTYGPIEGWLPQFELERIQTIADELELFEDRPADARDRVDLRAILHPDDEDEENR